MAGAVSHSEASVNRRPRKTLTNPKISGRLLAAVRNYFIAYLGALIETAQPGSLDGRNMYKHILAAAVGLNKSIAFGRVEPLNRAYCHVVSPLDSKTRNDGDRIPAKERARQGAPRTKKPPLG
jgi:hypothetical protein